MPQGNTPERVLELVRAKGLGTQLLPAAGAAVRTKERLDTVEGLVGLPAHVGERYLPAKMGEAEIDAAIDAAIAETGAVGAADMGKLMGVLKPKLAGQADMGLVSKRVKARLG